MIRGVPRRALGPPIALSAALHVGAAALLLLARPESPAARPPMYKVNIVAAPPGPRAVGVVTPTPPATPPPKEATVPPRAEVTRPAPVLPPAKAVPQRRTPPPPATPVPSTARTNAPTTPAPQAGGGPTGGRGTDVATVRTEGIEFPFPGYLQNIVRQIALNFKPPNPQAALRAEVAFLIHRDGSISSFRFLTRSGMYSFDLEAQGAVEQAARAFGPLPPAFSDDVLPIIFSFDPSLVR